MRLRDRPVLTRVFASTLEFVPDAGSCYIAGISVEERSSDSQRLKGASDISFVEITNQAEASFELSRNGVSSVCQLRSRRQLVEFWDSVSELVVYLDITGLDYHIWAPLLRTSLECKKRVRVVYVEPQIYRASENPIEGEFFDLSEKIRGISPLPGFATLDETDDERVCFVPLLGFQGTRLAYVVEQVQPPGGNIYPIVGLPGFRAEYPFHAFHANQIVLQSTKAWRNLSFVAANCPFALYYTLQDIAAKFPRYVLKIAPIGTKPHALGALLFALANPDRVEIVFDHPIRKANSTLGTARLMVYDVGALLAGYLPPSRCA